MSSKVRRTLERVHRALTLLVVTGIAPWIVRIDEVRSQMAINVEADRKVAQLTDEIQNLIKTVRTKVCTPSRDLIRV